MFIRGNVTSCELIAKQVIPFFYIYGLNSVMLMFFSNYVIFCLKHWKFCIDDLFMDCSDFLILIFVRIAKIQLDRSGCWDFSSSHIGFWLVDFNSWNSDFFFNFPVHFTPEMFDYQLQNYSNIVAGLTSKWLVREGLGLTRWIYTPSNVPKCFTVDMVAWQKLFLLQKLLAEPFF